jgi:2-methylcitrate dehydratase PrpD
MTLSHEIANWARALQFSSIPGPAINKAKECIADICGVTLAGELNIFSRQLREALMPKSTTGSSLVVGTDMRTDSHTAALINAFAAHILDFDDTSYKAGAIHATAVIFPTILALGEELTSSGKDVLTAYLVGFEITGKIGIAANQLFKRGWFTSSVFGAIGAAAAAAKLLKLDTDKFQNALGLAMSQIGGLRQNNGTPGKAYAVGLAAANGVRSALLAQKGFRASAEIFEGSEGFFHVYCDDQYDSDVFGQLGKPLVILSPGVALKPYPTCSSAHAAMEAAHAIVIENEIRWEQIVKVRCKTTQMALRFLFYDNPRTVEQALFSLPFCIACILKEGAFELRHLSEDMISDPTIRKLMGQVEAEAVKQSEADGSTADMYPEGAEVTIWTKNGRKFTKYIGEARGCVSRPFSKKEQSAKFISCAKDILALDQARSCLEIIEHLEKLKDIGELTQSLAP